MLYNVLPEGMLPYMTVSALVISFLLTVVFTAALHKYLPKDGGRDFAVDGKKSAGKPRGAGIIFILSYAFTAFLLTPMPMEYIYYLLLVLAAMMSGFLDDAAKSPWGEYLKGALDLLIAMLVTFVFLWNNEPVIHLALFGTGFRLPIWLFAIGAVCLIWVSINVTNCADGVDGLSGTVSIITLVTFYGIMNKLGVSTDFAPQILVLVMAILAYLWFNSTPSILMMGDAGSRAIGLFIAISALKSGAPFIYLLVAIVLILDGGLGLLKVSVRRFLKAKRFMEGIRTPLHDQVRKVNGWSNTQCVYRFAIIQAVIGVIVYNLVR